MGKKSAPEPDARIGDAALRSAELGQQYLDFMRPLADETMGWAREDRERNQSVFQPLQDRYIAEATNYASPERMQKATSEAAADVRQEASLARGASSRNMAAMGVNPASGRFASEDRRLTAGEGIAAAGAKNMARRQVEAVGEGKMANAINMGNQTAVSPASLAGLSGQQAGSGFSGAMQGQGQMGSLLNTQYQQQMQGWQARQSMYGGIGGALGSIAGVFISSKEKKTDKRRPAISSLDAIKNMPVEEWKYKDGEGDGGGKVHIGPYAEDFQKETGLGDGKTISIIDAIGVNMGATKELAEQIDRIESAVTGKAAPPKRQRGAVSIRDGVEPRPANRKNQPISARA